MILFFYEYNIDEKLLFCELNYLAYGNNSFHLDDLYIFDNKKKIYIDEIQIFEKYDEEDNTSTHCFECNIYENNNKVQILKISK